MDYKKVILVTGGLGFIGSAFLREYVPAHPDWLFVNVDDCRPGSNERAIEAVQIAPNYEFIRQPLEEVDEVTRIMIDKGITDVIHFAANSDVDSSIRIPTDCVFANICSTLSILEGIKALKNIGHPFKRMVYVSTDEVYGTLTEEDAPRKETDKTDPRNPYSASKLGSEAIVRAYANTYDLDVVITRGCNTFGPWQMPTKLIPRSIQFLREGKKMPMYGDGQQVREWMPVWMHVDGIYYVWKYGRSGEVYNIGTGSECTNQRVLQFISETLKQNEPTDSHIESVPDRPGHDRRYALDTTKVRRLGWNPMDLGMKLAIEGVSSWYWDNPNYTEGANVGTI